MKIFRAEWLILNADRVLQNSALLVDEGKVFYILTSDEVDMVVSDYCSIPIEEHHLIFPGFINAHMHQYGILSHGIPINVKIKDFEDFLEKFWWPYMEDRISQKEVLVTAKASAAEMIESGIIGFCDTLEAPKSETGTLVEQGKVIDEIGMRAILSIESCERIDTANGLYCLEENEKFIKWAREYSTMVSGAISTHTSFTCSVPFMEKARDMAEKHDCLWQFHLSESRYEPDYTLKKFGKRAVNHYANNNLLSDKVIASQCVKVDSEEIKILKKKRVRPVHMPLSNCEVGGGFAPVPEMLKKGIPVALGTDGYDNDFIRTMQMAFLIHKAALEDPSAMPASEVFRMATENGAKTLGWEECGTLDVNKMADFVCMENLFSTPLNKENLFDQLVVYSKKEFISHVYCNGKPLLKNRELVTLNKESVRKEVNKVAAEFWKDL
jgi:cytosine/adenosine deaminase-related metal-dependent hydrolase